MAEYKQRIADRLLSEKLDAMGAVLIEGPKACGKTTTAEQQAKSILYMDDPTKIKQNLHLAETNIKLLLKGDTPRLIDEWQLAPQLWDAIRFEVDHRDEDGQFMLTGSAVPKEKDKDKIMNPDSEGESRARILSQDFGNVNLGSRFVV